VGANSTGVFWSATRSPGSGTCAGMVAAAVTVAETRKTTGTPFSGSATHTKPTRAGDRELRITCRPMQSARPHQYQNDAGESSNAPTGFLRHRGLVRAQEQREQEHEQRCGSGIQHAASPLSNVLLPPTQHCQAPRVKNAWTTDRRQVAPSRGNFVPKPHCPSSRTMRPLPGLRSRVRGGKTREGGV